MAHDYRLMREDRGWVCLNEVRLRLRFPPGICGMLAAKCTNSATLTDLLVFGKRFTGPEALSSKLVDGVCPAADLVENSILLAEGRIGPEQFDRASVKTMKVDLYKNAYAELTNKFGFDSLELLSPTSSL